METSAGTRRIIGGWGGSVKRSQGEFHWRFSGIGGRQTQGRSHFWSGIDWVFGKGLQVSPCCARKASWQVGGVVDGTFDLYSCSDPRQMSPPMPGKNCGVNKNIPGAGAYYETGFGDWKCEIGYDFD